MSDSNEFSLILWLVGIVLAAMEAWPKTGFMVWLAVNALDGFWLYTYVVASLDANPPTPINKSHTALVVFSVFMEIFGFIWGCVNLAIACIYCEWLFGRSCQQSGKWYKAVGTAQDVASALPTTTGYLFPAVSNGWKTTFFDRLRLAVTVIHAIVVVPIFICMVILPFFGMWTIPPIVQTYIWDHRCNVYPMYAVLDGRGWKDPGTTPSVARFYQTGSTSSLFSYTISIGHTSDDLSFYLRTFDTQQSAIPLDIYPTLQHVQYSFLNNTLSGSCATPVAPGSNNVTTSSCMQGTFNPDTPLSFQITSTVPLNTTTIDDTPSNTAIHLRSIYKYWSFPKQAPSLILRTVDPSQNSLQQVVLRTGVTFWNDCTRLKVCIAGIEGRQGGAVGPEVMAPLGLLLSRQSDYALQCTAPRRHRY